MPVKTAFRKTIFHLLLIVFVGLASYANTFTVPFQFDDLSQIVDNPFIKDLGNFTSSAKGYALNLSRYIGNLSFALNYHFGGLNVAGYHIVNLAIHILNAVLVYFLVVLTFRTPFFRRETLGVKREKSGNSDQQLEVSSEQHGNHSLFAIHYSRFIALFSALLFVAHPVQTQAVTYIIQRFTSLATMFYLLSAVMYIKGRLGARGYGLWEKSLGQADTKGGLSVPLASRLSPIAYYLLSFSSAVLAMKTKEIAFTLPVMLVTYEFTFFKSTLKRKLAFLVPFLVLLVIIPISMMDINKPLGEMLSDLDNMTRVQTDMSRPVYLMTQMRVIVTYIRLLFMPVNQNADYSYTIYHTFFAPPVFLSFLLLSTLFGTAVYLLYKSQKAISAQQSAVRSKEKTGKDGPSTDSFSPLTTHCSLFTPSYSRLIAFGIFWFFIALSVESSVIPIIDLIYEHRVYLPSAGVFIAVAAAAGLLAMKIEDRWPRAKKAVIYLGLIIVVVLSFTTFARNKVWKDDLSLWEDVARKAPDNARGHDLLGNAYFSRGFFDKAIREYETAVRIQPKYDMAYYNLGNAYAEQGLNDKAIENYNKVIALNPLHYQTYANRGVTFVSMGQFDMAIKDFNAVIAIHPSHMVYFLRGAAFEKKGQTDRAIEDYHQVINLNPSYLEAYIRLGILYGKAGALDKAIDQFNQAVTINPDYSLAYGNRGFAYSLTGQYDLAIRDLTRAIELDKDDAGSFINRGKVYRKIGKKELAIQDFRKACDMGSKEGCEHLKSDRF